MKHLVYTTKLNYFPLLTSKEQLDEVRRYFMNCYDMSGVDNYKMYTMLNSSCRDEVDLQHEYDRMCQILNCGAVDLLTEAQKEDLEFGGHTTVLVPHGTEDKFRSWLRLNRLHCTIVVLHDSVDAFECLVHKDRYIEL